MLGGQVRRPRGQAPAVHVDRLGQVLVQRALDHYLLADVAQRVGDRAGRYVAAEHVAHVLPRGAVSRHVSEVPTGQTECHRSSRRLPSSARLRFAKIIRKTTVKIY